MAQLSITNVVNISVSQAQQGANEYNVNNLAIFTSDTPGITFPAAGYAIYLDPSQVGVDFGTNSNTYKMANAVFSQQPNILAGGGSLIIIPIVTDLVTTLANFKDVVQFFGIISTLTQETLGDPAFAAMAAAVQPLNKMFFSVSATEADLLPVSGAFYVNTTDGLSHTRCLFYDDSTGGGINELLFMVGYVGRALSTNFNGSNTTQTMHLKQIIGVSPDPNLTQTILNEAQIAGADCYPSLQGTPAVFCSGANSFFDQVYNLLWIVGALQIAGFNYLATVNTKIPQTESGMDGLKQAYGAVCQQGVFNQYLAPGVWNSPTTFGNQQNFLSNILQRGYYIFSQPIGQQSQTDRAARKAPLVQIALKEAGAIQSSNVIIYVNP